MKEKLLAKSDGTTLEEHTEALLICYSKWLKTMETISPDFLDKIKGHEKILCELLFYHDQGKRNLPFQRKVRGGKNVPQVYHEYISLAFLSVSVRNRWGIYACYALVHHHHRNPEKLKKMWDELWDKQIAAIKRDYEKSEEDRELDWSMLENNGWNGLILPTKYKDKNHFGDDFNLFEHVFYKGMLHRCDYAASAGLDLIEKKYEGELPKEFIKGKPLSPLQLIAPNYTEKSVILIAPTGSGKTEFAMNWVRKKTFPKVFYLLGMRTATKKMFDRWKDIFNGNVELLHGDIAIEFLAQPEEEQEANISDRLALARQLINPITVATADQLVTAALKYHSFETIYLTAAYSQIVVDEIQSFDPQAMAIIVTFLKDIHVLGGRFLLMTATLPPFIQDELKKLGNVETLDPLGDKDCPAAHNMEKNRHKYSWHKSKAINDGDSIKKIISSFEDESIEKVLVLCNTVSIAQDIFTKINIALKGEVISVNLLHSKFTRSARKQKEEKITGDARVQGERDGNRVIWVSTQIVEASLDLDFDMLHTEISTIDSLSQRFGRVWRTRAYDGVNPNIFIYDNVNVGNIENYTIKIYDRELLGITKRYLDSFAMKLLSEKDKHKMFNQIFGELDEDGRYRKRYNEMLKLLKNGFKVENRDDAQERLRESGMFTYNLITEKYRESAEELFRQLENAKGRERLDLQAQIMDLCVPTTLPCSVKKGVRSALEPLAEIYPKYFFAKSIYFAGVPFKYDDTIGLTYDNKFGSDSAIFI